MTKKQLFAAAAEALKNSYAPYSGYNVGAALLCSDGTVYTGVNVENASFPAGCCAERTAVFSAVADGHRDFTAIAIAAGKGGVAGDSAFPCGICRQVLSEFCDSDFKIYTGKSIDEISEFTLGELLPYSFGSANLR